MQKKDYTIGLKVCVYNKSNRNIINKDNFGVITNIETVYEDNGSHYSGDETYYTITKLNGEIFKTKYDWDFTDLESYMKYFEIESVAVIKRAEEQKIRLENNIKLLNDFIKN